METKFATGVSLPDGLTPEKVRGYLERRANDIASIRSALSGLDDVGTRHQLREIAHRVKGNAALYGLPELGQVAGELVQAVDRGDWTAVTLSGRQMVDRVEEERIRFQR